MTSIKDIDFASLAKKEKNARMQQRLLALAHFQDGKSRYKIAEYLKVSRTSVNKWISEFLRYGLEGLKEAPRSGRPTKLTQMQLEQLSTYIEQQAARTTGGRLTGYDVQAYILANFDVDYELSNVYRILHAQGFSWITSRSRHPKQSQEAQEAFKKLPAVNDPSHPGASTTRTG